VAAAGQAEAAVVASTRWLDHDALARLAACRGLVKTTTTGPGGSSTQNTVWVMHTRDGQATELWVHNWDQAAIDAVMGG